MRTTHRLVPLGKEGRLRGHGAGVMPRVPRPERARGGRGAAPGTRARRKQPERPGPHRHTLLVLGMKGGAGRSPRMWLYVCLRPVSRSGVSPAGRPCHRGPCCPQPPGTRALGQTPRQEGPKCASQRPHGDGHLDVPQTPAQPGGPRLLLPAPCRPPPSCRPPQGTLGHVSGEGTESSQHRRGVGGAGRRHSRGRAVSAQVY